MSHEEISAGARQFLRHATRLRARLDPHPDHCDQFRLSYAGFSDDLEVIDVSTGGLALQSSFFVPRNMRFAIVVSGLKTSGGKDAGDVTVRAIVRRCALMDHQPTYQIGVQFIDPTGADEQALVYSTTTSCGDSASVVEVGSVG